tara:strand:- start:103 stop:534 length:432 start_codon:yes stop_codon:yes gene_type:complete
MKITQKILENIVKEEISKVLKESDIQKQLKAALPTVLQNDTAKQIFKVTKRAAQNKQVSVNDFLSVTKGLAYAVKSGDDMANIAVKDPSALQNAGLDIVVGDITQNIEDLGIGGRTSTEYSDYLTGGQQSFGKTYGVQLRLSL